MNKLLSILTCWLTLLMMSVSASAQGGGQSGGGGPGGGITVNGAVTPGHCTAFFSATQIEDSGGACGGTGASPGGSVNSFQYNNTVFGGTTLTDIQYSSATHTITIGSTGILSLAGASPTTGLVVPIAAGAAPTASGVIAFNSTTGLPVFGSGGSLTFNYPSTITVVANNFLTGFNNITGVFTQAQPTFSNISGTVTNVQLANSSLTVNGTLNQISTTSASIALGSSATLSISNPFIFPGKTTFAASTTGAASFNIPTGVAPTSASTGDVWFIGGAIRYNDGTNSDTLVSTESATTITPGNIPSYATPDGSSQVVLGIGYGVQGTAGNVLTSGTVSGNSTPSLH